MTPSIAAERGPQRTAKTNIYKALFVMRVGPHIVERYVVEDLKCELSCTSGPTMVEIELTTIMLKTYKTFCLNSRIGR